MRGVRSRYKVIKAGRNMPYFSYVPSPASWKSQSELRRLCIFSRCLFCSTFFPAPIHFPFVACFNRFFSLLLRLLWHRLLLLLLFPSFFLCKFPPGGDETAAAGEEGISWPVLAIEVALLLLLSALSANTIYHTEAS